MRQLPPVHSPLSIAAILAGVRAAADGARAEAVHATIVRDLSASHGAAALRLTDSGTSALTLAIRALASPAGRPVALPGFACFDIATAVDGAGGPFVLYDVDPATLAPDSDSLQRAIDSGADRVVFVHLYGVPAYTVPMLEHVTRSGVAVIDDAAQGPGASVDGRPVGARGSLGVLSFGRGKGVTGGSGGALLATDARGRAALEELAPSPARRGSVSEFVKLCAQWVLARPALYRIPASLPFLGLGETVYHAPHPPAAISDFAMGVLQRSMQQADAESMRRRTNAARLGGVLRDAGVRVVGPGTAGQVAGYLRLPCVVPPPLQSRFRSPEARRLGIMPSYPTALVELPGFGARRANPDETCPGARTLAASLFTVPTHAALGERDVREIERFCRALDPAASAGRRAG